MNACQAHRVYGITIYEYGLAARALSQEEKAAIAPQSAPPPPPSSHIRASDDRGGRSVVRRPPPSPPDERQPSRRSKFKGFHREIIESTSSRLPRARRTYDGVTNLQSCSSLTGRPAAGPIHRPSGRGRPIELVANTLLPCARMHAAASARLS